MNATFLAIGKLGKPYGLKGYLKAYASSDDHLSLMQYDPWYIETKTGFEILPIDDKQLQENAVLIHIENIHTPEMAKLLSSKTIAIKRSQLPDVSSDECYWTDLEGMTVMNEQGEILGIIDHLMRTGANDVMVVIGQKRHLIPFKLDTFVKTIDLKAKKMLVDWES